MSIQAPAGRRRFWIVVFCFAIANAAVWIGYDRFSAWRSRGSLRAESFEPGDGAVVSSRTIARWHFNEDVIPTASYGRDPGTTSPAVAGRWNWDDPRTLSFSPDAPLPRATRITFTLADAILRSDRGGRLTSAVTDWIDSSPLSVAEIRQSGRLSDDRYIVELHFNDRVTPADVLAHLAAKRENGPPVRCEIYGNATGKTVRVVTDSMPPVENQGKLALQIRLTPGLAGLSGPLGLTQEYSKTIGLDPATAALELTAEAPASQPPFLKLKFNNQVELSALKEILSVGPPVAFTLDGDDDQDVRIAGEFHPGARYTISLAAAPAGADGSKYPHPGKLSTFVPDRTGAVWLDNSQGYLSSMGNRTILAHAMNMDGMKVQITCVYDNNLVAWRNAHARYSWPDTSQFSRPLVERIFPVNGQKNVQRDIPLSLDDLLPAGAPRDGVYRVAISATKKSVEPLAQADDEYDDPFSSDGKTSSVVTMSDIGLTAKQTRDGVVVWATSLRTAQPLESVRVRTFSNKNQLLGEVATNFEGLANIANIHPARDETVAVVLADRLPREIPDVLGPTAQNIPPASRPSTDSLDLIHDLSRDLTWLDLRETNWELSDTDVGGAPYLRAGHEAFVYSDRGVYRPGETIHLRAVVRGPNNTAPKNSFPVKWQIRRPDLRDWKSQTAMLDADGAASLDLELPADLPTGLWSASVGMPGEDGVSATSAGASSFGASSFGSVDFSVEEFIPNRMKVSLGFDVAANISRYSTGGDPLKANIQADYLFGRPAAGLALQLSTRFDPVSFEPASWHGWCFGDSADVASSSSKAIPAAKHSRKQNQSDVSPTQVVLDSNGHYVWSIDAGSALGLSDESEAGSARYHGPWRLSASAGVSEPGGRTVTAAQQIEVDELPAYIGIRRADAASAQPGKPCELQINLVHPDGKLAAGNAQLEAKLLRQSWNTTLVFRDGRYHYDSTRILDPIESATVKLNGGVGTWSPTPTFSGSYIVSLLEPRSGAVSTMEFYATDGRPWNDNISRENPERLEVRVLAAGESAPADNDANATGSKASAKKQPKFNVGDTANVLIASPFPGQLLLTVESDDVLQTTAMEMTSSHMVVPVKITAKCWPNAFVSATVVRAIDPNAKWQTHRAFGIARLNVDPASRRLAIAINAPAEIQPLQSLDVGVIVKDSAGNPVANAAVTLAAVDEGILQLTNFATPDPLAFFARDRALFVKSSDLFGMLMPEVPQPGKTSPTGGDAAERAARARRHITPVVARRVKPVSLASSLVHTDSSGAARASFSLPQFQGQLRIVAVGYDTTRFGSADSDVTVRSPILAQTSWPRFAAPGDRFSVPLVLFNNTKVGGDAIVSVAMMPGSATATDLMQLGKDHQAKVDLPATALAPGGQRQIDLPVQIGQAVGVAKIHLHVSMNDQNYDEDMELPIRPAAPLMQTGRYASASTTRPTAIADAALMMPGTQAFEVRVSGFPALQLPQGLDYLDRYPYGCVEQTTSASFPLIALGEIGKQIDPVRFAPERIKFKIDAGITQLIGMQTSDGGLAMWPGGSADWPYASTYAAHFLVEARAAGYQVPEDFYSHLLTYVRGLLDDNSEDPEELETRSYAGYVLSLAGKPDRAILNRLTELAAAVHAQDDRDTTAMRSDSRLMLACAWLLAGRRDLAEGLIPVSLPQPRDSREPAGNLGSATRDRAMLIYTLAQVQPDNPALPDLVQQLADAGSKKQWASTHDTAFAILAIGKYLQSVPKPPAYETAQLFSGDKLLAEAASGAALAWTAPSSTNLSVKISGSANAVGYVSWLASGVPLSPPRDSENGIRIHRRYLDAGGNEIRGNTVRSGDLVHVELVLQAPANQANFVIEDLLPAGLEVENARLATSASEAKQDDTDDSKIQPLQSARMDARDDRVVFTGDMPNRERARCEYWARAVTPGIYIIPPVRAEAMYDIATSALTGAGGKFTVMPATSNIASTGD